MLDARKHQRHNDNQRTCHVSRDCDSPTCSSVGLLMTHLQSMVEIASTMTSDESASGQWHALVMAHLWTNCRDWLLTAQRGSSSRGTSFPESGRRLSTPDFRAGWLAGWPGDVRATSTLPACFDRRHSSPADLPPQDDLEEGWSSGRRSPCSVPSTWWVVRQLYL